MYVFRMNMTCRKHFFKRIYFGLYCAGDSILMNLLQTLSFFYRFIAFLTVQESPSHFLLHCTYVALVFFSYIFLHSTRLSNCHTVHSFFGEYKSFHLHLLAMFFFHVEYHFPSFWSLPM